MFVRMAIADKMTSMNAIYHVLAALVTAERQGIGQEIKLSMIDSLLSFIAPDSMFGHAFVPDDEFRHLSMSRATLQPMPTKDGYIVACAATDDQWERMCGAMGKPEWVEQYPTPADRARYLQEILTSINLRCAHFYLRFREMRQQTVITLSSKADQFTKASWQLGERRQRARLTDTRQRNALDGACRRASVVGRAGAVWGSPVGKPARCAPRGAHSRRPLSSLKPHPLSPTAARAPGPSGDRAAADRAGSGTTAVLSGAGSPAQSGPLPATPTGLWSGAIAPAARWARRRATPGRMALPPPPVG